MRCGLSPIVANSPILARSQAVLAKSVSERLFREAEQPRRLALVPPGALKCLAHEPALHLAHGGDESSPARMPRGDGSFLEVPGKRVRADHRTRVHRDHPLDVVLQLA